MVDETPEEEQEETTTDEPLDREESRDRLIVTTKFAARLAGILARRDPDLAKEIRSLIKRMTPTEVQRQSDEKVESKAWGQQIGLIDQMYQEESGGG